ncbi:hypothetical protein EK0264_16215 [Epidermidibacterium keratini]|uniref:Integral membrane protein n=1 Tax=Epidermidibacterium keratini TaxID=1891644 RepID=A0A7L4YR15_9ACTN|nr:hypothetical protein [Epidermidibacterium keratini]QHC01681.1 hypothetical protein EK0264_16215 [Epidermidibacterium keratini]
MLDWLRWVIIALSLLLAIVGYLDFRGAHAPRRPTLVLAAAGWAAVVVQAVVAVVALVRGDRPGEFATFIGYLFTTLLMVPAAAYFRAVERSKWASVAFAIAGVTVAVLMMRLDQLWRS